ncbi:hypothetical protein VZT92_024722 [Zoarces viviparus]|uniref:Uncharacterized protein n=1 Tax=Zoarces viviparus TaxID=48416 RepID=A0AAW1E3J5_ZOAVI
MVGPCGHKGDSLLTQLSLYLENVPLKTRNNTQQLPFVKVSVVQSSLSKQTAIPTKALSFVSVGVIF